MRRQMVQDKQGRQPKYLSRTHTQPISDGTHTEDMESSCYGAHLDGFFNHDSSQRQSLEPSAAHGVHWLPSLVCDAARPPPSSVLSHVAESLHKSCARRRHLLLRKRRLELHCHTGSKAWTRSSHLRHTYGFSRAGLVLLRRKQGPSHVLHAMLDIHPGSFEEPTLESQPLRAPHHRPHSRPKRPRSKNL